jgi:hypothetical protein
MANIGEICSHWFYIKSCSCFVRLSLLLTFQSLEVSVRTTRLNIQNFTWCSLCFECFVRISEQTATCAVHIINWLVFITVVGSVYSAVQTGSLYKADCVECFVRISEQTATFALYIINWLGFITVVESVYSAVRTDCLYKADCVECFVRISEQRATFALYIINWLVFITVVESVYSAVRNDCLYKADYV